MRRRLLGVLESKWFSNEITVRPLFDLLCDARHERGDYIYERFVSKSSLEEVLRFVIKKRVSYIYVGSHCAGSKIECPNGERVPVRRLRDVIAQACESRRSKVSGLFLSGCYIVNHKNAKAILGHRRNGNPLHWVGGYGGSPEWFPSSALDALFFSVFFDEEGRDRRALENAAKRFVWSRNSIAKEYKFNIYVRDPAGAGGIVNLTAS